MENIKLSIWDVIKAILLCSFEITILRFIILIARLSAFIGYKKRRKVWDRVDREKIDFNLDKKLSDG